MPHTIQIPAALAFGWSDQYVPWITYFLLGMITSTALFLLSVRFNITTGHYNNRLKSI